MFFHRTELWGRFEIHRLYNETEGLSFSVAPQRGACLLDLQFKGRNVLDGYTGAAGLKTLDWAKSALLAPFPNRLKDGRYSAGGEEFQFPLNDAERGNALHGFVLDKPFEVEQVTLAPEKATIALIYRYSGDILHYPFPFSLRVTYTLKSPADFELSLNMENTGNRELPAGLGWHPYFQLGVPADALELQLPPVEKISVDERMIPTGEKRAFTDFQKLTAIAGAAFDTGFLLSSPGPVSEVHFGNGPARLCYWQDRAFPYLQVFIPPARQSIALEPMSCNIDAFHNGEGLRILNPGERIEGKAGIRLL